MAGRVELSAKALIAVDGRILVIRKDRGDGAYCALPGGHVEYGESLAQAVARECREETGLSVRVGDVVAVRDYVGVHHEVAQDNGRHKVEVVFACHPEGDPGEAVEPDRGQVGLAWLRPEALEGARFRPRALAAALVAGRLEGGPVYLGDVN